MASETLTYNPSSQPNSWALLIGPDRFGSVAFDSFNRYISHIDYFGFDPYTSNVFKQRAREIFTERAEIRTIQVAFLMSDWCWLPTAIVKEKEAHKLLSEIWPDKPGHEWVADSSGPSEATAWVRVPTHLIEQLKNLSTIVEFKHASLFGTHTSNDTTDRLDIIRVGSWSWYSIWKQGSFQYAQPHCIAGVDDLLYTISLLVETHQLNPDRLNLQLLGEWPIDSEELTALRNRFRQLQGKDIDWKNLPGDQPSHWYTPLANMFS